MDALRSVLFLRFLSIPRGPIWGEIWVKSKEGNKDRVYGDAGLFRVLYGIIKGEYWTRLGKGKREL